MYDVMQSKVNWPQKAKSQKPKDVCTTVAYCRRCWDNGGNKMQIRYLKHSQASSSPGFNAMDILSPLLRRINGNQLLVIMTDQYLKLTRTVPSPKTSTTHIPFIFYNHYIESYKIRAIVLKDHCTQVVNKLFDTLSKFIGLMHLRTTAYNSQTSGQAARYNGMLIAKLYHFVSDPQHD